MANLFSKKIKGEEHRSQLQPVVFSDEEKPVAALKKSQIDNYDELESYKKLRKKRIRKACIRMVVWCLMLVLMPLFVFFSLVIINPNGHNIFGYTFYIVVSESMRPNIEVGDCVIIKNITSKDDVYIGADITFVRKSDGETVTHKIIKEVVNEDGEIEYITKGTNNINADAGTVSFENIIGVRVATAHVLGQVISFFRTPYGIVTFLAIFVLIIFGFYISFKLSDDIRAVGVK